MTSVLFQGIKHAELYSKYRPYPPGKLIEEVVEYLKNKLNSEPPFNKAIDIGCGSGQSTVAISPYFKNVLGLDISEAQIKYAKEIHMLANIEYKLSSGEDIPVSSNSIELVTLCQAVHWFNPPNDLYKEISRILKCNGTVAAYGYWIPVPKTGNSINDKEINELITHHLHDEKLGTFWDKERFLVQNHYADLEFPFKDCHKMEFKKESESTLADYMGYLSTWSSYQKLLKKNPESAKELLKDIEKRLKLILQNTECSEKIPLKLCTDYFMLIGHM